MTAFSLLFTLFFSGGAICSRSGQQNPRGSKFGGKLMLEFKKKKDFLFSVIF
jgi:hypothetical protein